jgi:hypothetical protein
MRTGQCGVQDLDRPLRDDCHCQHLIGVHLVQRALRGPCRRRHGARSTPTLPSCCRRRTKHPTAAEYAETIHIADMCAFASANLAALDAGITHSMPIYRLYPATSEREAIELWWRSRSFIGVEASYRAIRPTRPAVMPPSTTSSDPVM